MSARMSHAVTVVALLRGQVVGRAEGVERPVSGSASSREQSGQAEVEHLDRAVPVEEQVGRLDVAMDPAGLVGVLQTAGRLGDVVGRRRRIDRARAG